MKMIRIVAAAAMLLPVVVLAQGVVAQPRPAEVYLWHRATSFTAGLAVGGSVAKRPTTVTRVAGIVGVGGSSGGGAGNTVITFTDGTNTCLATIACSASAAAAGTVVSATMSNGAGTGCSYGANASITASVTTAGCSGSQPALYLNAYGEER